MQATLKQSSTNKNQVFFIVENLTVTRSPHDRAGLVFKLQTQAHTNEDGGGGVRQIRWTGAEKQNKAWRSLCTLDSGGSQVPGMFRNTARARDDAMRALGVPALLPTDGEVDQSVLSAVPAAGVQLGP